MQPLILFFIGLVVGIGLTALAVYLDQETALLKLPAPWHFANERAPDLVRAANRRSKDLETQLTQALDRIRQLEGKPQTSSDLSPEAEAILKNL